MSEGLSGTEVGKEIAEHAKHGSGHHAPGAARPHPRDRRGGSALAGHAGGGLVGLRGGQVERRIRRVADRGIGGADGREPGPTSTPGRTATSTCPPLRPGSTPMSPGTRTRWPLRSVGFRPEFAVAFDAWRATNPETNLAAPRGPTYMPEYEQPGLEAAKALDEKADQAFAEGVSAGQTSDSYVRATVFLASVLFLVGISSHFPGRGARYWLIGLSAAVLVVSLVQLAQLPRPPA